MRTQQAIDTRADVVASARPFRIQMFEDDIPALQPDETPTGSIPGPKTLRSTLYRCTLAAGYNHGTSATIGDVRMPDRANLTPPSDDFDLHETPGIIVDRRPAEVRARIRGTGLEVWEVVKTYHEVGEDWRRFRACYERLTEKQLRAALAYAARHWKMIEGRIAEDYAHVPESLRVTIPARWR